MEVRINKFLAGAGLGSRREVESLIEQGRVTLNSERANFSDSVMEGDIVALNGEELPVDDILREIEAEEKERIAMQMADLRFSDDYNYNERSYNGNTSFRNRNNKAPKGPTKFKKNAEEYDRGFSQKKEPGCKKKLTDNKQRSHKTQTRYENNDYHDFSEEVRDNRKFNRKPSMEHSKGSSSFRGSSDRSQRHHNDYSPRKENFKRREK